VDALGPHGTILGLKEVNSSEQSHTTLEAGDVALLYSDGLFAFKQPDGERFTHENLREAVRMITPGVAFFDRLLSALHSGSNGEPFSDDMAGIVLQRG
jgi:serine phosphatase RsbU (regulator of sigma subunit)